MNEANTHFYQVVLIVTAIAGVIVCYFIVSIIKQNRRLVALVKKTRLAELRAHEQERSRIAADLHDDLAPSIAIVRLLIQDVKVNTEDEKIIQKVSDHISSILSKIRELTNNITPLVIQNQGLARGIEKFIDSFSSAEHLKIQFAHGNIPPLPDDMSLNIYRIIQEVVFNTIKHSKASELLVELNLENRTLVLATKDNGCGYNFEKVRSEKAGNGLFNIQNRTEILNGKFYMDSSSLKGTTYIFKIPIPATGKLNT